MKKWLFASLAAVTFAGFTVVPADTTEAATKYITKAKAKQLALKTVSGTVVDIDFENDRTPHYEIDIRNAKEEVELEVNAVTGKVKITDREAIKKPAAKKKTTIITKNKAIQIAKAKLNGKGTVSDVELESDNGVRYYEMELKHGKKEYDVKINAVTGKIIKFKLD